MCVVSSDGTVLYIAVARTKSTCTVDIRLFPFDTQYCHLKFGSWTYDGFKVDLDFYDGLEEVDVSDYIESNQWGLVGHPAVKNVKYYPCCQEPYPDLTFSLKLQRMSGYYIYMLVIPGILFTLLIPVVFLIPVGRPEKFTLGMCSTAFIHRYNNVPEVFLISMLLVVSTSTSVQPHLQASVLQKQKKTNMRPCLSSSFGQKDKNLQTAVLMISITLFCLQAAPC